MSTVLVWSHFTGETWSGELELPAAPDAALERVYRLLNRVSGGDAQRLEAIGYRLPSLSVGDIVELDGVRYRVVTFGFERADEPTSDPLVRIEDELRKRRVDPS